MTAYSEAGLKTAKNLALANNSSEAITPTVHRNYEEDQIDSSVNKVDGSYLRTATITAGTQPAYTITLTDKYPTAYVEDIPILLKAHDTSDPSATLNVNSIGAKKIYRPDSTITQAGDIVTNQLYIVLYDGDLDASAGGFRIVPGFGGGTAFTVTTGATDNAILRADGTGGSTLQNSLVVIDDSGNVTGVVALTATGAISGTTGTFTGDIILQGILKESNPTGSMTLSGGTSSILGSNITLYAESHGSSANGFLFKAGPTTVLNYDHSATNWGFTGSLSVSSFTGTADALTGSTSGGVLTDVTIGSGLSLSSGTLSVSGSIGVTESTYTPTLTAAGGSPTITYTTQTGRWQKVDDWIEVKFEIEINTISGGSGVYQITLPETGTSGEDFVGQILLENVTYSTSVTNYVLSLSSLTGYVTIEGLKSGTTARSMQTGDSNIVAGSILTGQIRYKFQ
jgi:hypothetical protein